MYRTAETPATLTTDRFVLQHTDPEDVLAPVMVDIDELMSSLSGTLEVIAHGGATPDDLPRIYRWVAGSPDTIEQLTLRLDRPGTFNSDDWAYSEWVVEGPPERIYARFTIRVDGRA
ncbi:hypothetical protein [Mycobacteroides abscessus]|uniref:hypothetical protein n=1 Tax=Mycobacteroides abscessus TaxID=36809 RepID=UPI0009A8F2A0|nr:hypothetical protein [Mycobacteroides abscessus]SLH39345.1 Uncharacterised protein [Mycobacteroides abscessus subsp. massiliense]